MKHGASTMLVATAGALALTAHAQTQQLPSDLVPDTRLAAMVPAGIPTQSACIGFRSLSECSAALHVSQNLNIPFADVKERVSRGDSLAAAVHALKPSADTRRALRRAEAQAREDVRPIG